MQEIIKIMNNIILQQINEQNKPTYIVTQDDWLIIDKEEIKQYINSNNINANLLIPVEEYINNNLLHKSNIGVLINSNQEIDILEPYLTKLPVIAFNFETFRDGRAYSKAYLLKTRFGYNGQIRAVGDVLKDQLSYMARCGFNVFVVRKDKDINDAIKAFNDFSKNYQADVLKDTPVYNDEK